jgi:hypothetical protein
MKHTSLEFFILNVIVMGVYPFQAETNSKRTSEESTVITSFDVYPIGTNCHTCGNGRSHTLTD